MIDADFKALQLRAFEAQLALQANTLTFNGLTATVIASPIGTSKLMRDAGYLPGLSSHVEMKRSDFDFMRLQDRSIVRLDGVELLVSVSNPDAADALISLTLAPAGVVNAE